MAHYTDRQWIMSLIQNAYTTTDDTGSCEVILQHNEEKRKVAEFPFLAQVDDLNLFHPQIDPEPDSPNVSTDVDLPRHRSYTERKTERLKKERERASRVKRVPWKYDPSLNVNESELTEMFQRKTSFARRSDTSDGEPPPKATSLLSQLLNNSELFNNNAFLEYSKFDGMIHTNVSTKQLNIYLYIGKSPSIDYPMKVSVVCSARVSDLIGLICWIYTKEKRQPPLKSIEYYELHIADEDGQYDREFMPLEKGYIIEKYGFNTLALVEKETLEATEGIIVTVNFARGAFSKIEVPNKEVTLREILNKSISRRKEIARMKEAGVDYHLEKEHEPGIVLKLDKTLGQVQCTEFAAVRDNKISGDRFAILPLSTKGGNSILPLLTPAHLSYHISRLIECNKGAAKKGKVELVITVRGEDRFKVFKFLCDPLVADEIYDKCRSLIKINSSRGGGSDVKQSSFRRHNSLSLRRKTKNSNSSFEI